MAPVIKDTPDKEVRLHIDMAESEIDTKLRARYHWPIQPDGTDLSTEANLPKVVRTMTVKLAAGMLEQARFANQMTADGDGISHGVSLMRDARALLKELVAGDSPLPGATRLGGAPAATLAPARPGQHYQPMQSRGGRRPF